MSSLIAYCRPDSISSSELGTLVANPFLGTISDLGFADDAGLSISHRPPRPEKVPYDLWCSDKFFHVRQADRGHALGSVEISEAFVHDNYMRGEIDFTGLRLVISLGAQALHAYRDYIGTVVRDARSFDDSGRRLWDGSLVFKIPARRFAFPMPRGSSDPWGTGTRAVGRLKPVAHFALDALEVIKLQDDSGWGVDFDDVAGGRSDRLQPALRLSGV